MISAGACPRKGAKDHLHTNLGVLANVMSLSSQQYVGVLLSVASL